jgi:geranylgeranyl pyrophosphate synthase
MSKTHSPSDLALLRSASSDLRLELASVEQELLTALADLHPPFSRLVANELKRIEPLVRGAVVLAAGIVEPDTEELKAQRIYLGAAIEMLHLALGIHTRLLPSPEGSQEVDRSVLGSAILAGDFCFSRAAGLAVRTNSATVVDVFAQALQRVSEGHLRHSFTADARPFDENRELFASGITAAGSLAGYAPATMGVALAIGAQVADALRDGNPSSLQLPANSEHVLTLPQHARWQALFDWLQAH